MAHVTPVIDADRHYAKIQAYDQRAEESQQIAEDGFMTACMKADANALADYAPMVTDWDKPLGVAFADGSRHRPKRSMTHAECMIAAFGHPESRIEPMMIQAMQAILNIAYGNVPFEIQREQARDLLERAGVDWARFNTEVE